MKITTYTVLLSFFLLLHSFTANTQGESIDSLQKVLQTQKEDTNKINTLNELASILIQISDYPKSLEYANKALKLSETLNFKKGKGLAYKNLGGSHQNFDEALNYLNNALIILKETGEKQDIGDCYFKIGSTYFYLRQNVPEALKNILIALQLFEQTGQKKSIADCFKLLGILYHNQGEKTEALTQSLNALKVYEEIKDSVGIAYIWNVIGNIYITDGKESEALKNYLNALKIYEHLGKRGPDFGISWTQRNIGNIYQHQAEIADAAGNKTEAENKFKEALALFNTIYKSEEEKGISHGETYILLGRYYTILGKRTQGSQGNTFILKSKMLYEKALEVAKQSGHKTLLANCYFSLAYLNVLLGNYREGYNNQSMYILYKDSAFNEQNTRQTVQLKMQYEFDKKNAVAKAEQGKKDAETKRTRNLQYTAIAAILLLAIILYWNNRQKQNAKNKIEKAYSELKSTQSQLIQSEKMASLGELTAGIAHEIQNPLNFVNNFSEVSTELVDEMNTEIGKGNLEDAKLIGQDLKQNLEKINHHGKRAGDIVKGMLQHSRSSSGVKEPTDINALADEYLRLAYHGLRAKDKSFNAIMKTDFDESIGNINIIPQDIGRVILNLITNAFYAVTEKKKQMPPSPKGEEGAASYNYEPVVTVTTKRLGSPPAGGDGGKVEIRVKDNGNGIPKKVLDKIFHPFFTTKPTGQGTGLGLSLAYDIIKAHGGELRVETPPAGRAGKEGEGLPAGQSGAEFIIQLPLKG
jgi:signal transduction histidine kinase